MNEQLIIDLTIAVKELTETMRTKHETEIETARVWSKGRCPTDHVYHCPTCGLSTPLRHEDSHRR